MSDVIDYRLTQVERVVGKMSEAIDRLVRLEERHLETRDALERAFKIIDENVQRIAEIEKELPTLKLTRAWVIAAAVSPWAILAAVTVKWLSGQG